MSAVFNMVLLLILPNFLEMMVFRSLESGMLFVAFPKHTQQRNVVKTILFMMVIFLLGWMESSILQSGKVEMPC